MEPVILPRAGTFPTFGPSEIGAITIPATFQTTPENAIVAAGGFEAAFLYLFKRLNPFNTQPGQLRAEYNDGTKVTTQAVIRVLGRSGSRNRNERLIDFVSVGLFEELEDSTASGSFS